MERRAMLAGMVAAAWPAPVRAQADAALVARGWRHGEYDGIAPARFHATEDGMSLEGEGAASFIWRPLQGPAACLSWRWRVDLGPPPTDLTRRGGDDRAVSLAVGFGAFPPRATVWQRAQHGIAQARAGRHQLPRAVLLYCWGGTGQEPPHFYSPWMAGLGKVRILRPATASRGQWFEEQVDLGAHWRESFGGDPPPLQEIAIGTDADDTQTRIAARVERIRLGPCRLPGVS